MTARETGGLPPSDTTDGIDTQTGAVRTDGGTDVKQPDEEGPIDATSGNQHALGAYELGGYSIGPNDAKVTDMLVGVRNENHDAAKRGVYPDGLDPEEFAGTLRRFIGHNPQYLYVLGDLCGHAVYQMLNEGGPDHRFYTLPWDELIERTAQVTPNEPAGGVPDPARTVVRTDFDTMRARREQQVQTGCTCLPDENEACDECGGKKGFVTDGGTDVYELYEPEPDKQIPPTRRGGAKQNRVATKSHLHELGFIGVEVTMEDRDTALIDPTEIPEPRKDLFELYAENAEPYSRTGHQRWAWVVNI